MSACYTLNTGSALITDTIQFAIGMVMQTSLLTLFQPVILNQIMYIANEFTTSYQTQKVDIINTALTYTKG